MNRPEQRATNDLIGMLGALQRALVAETEALRARDVDALERAVADKREALSTLGRLPPSAAASAEARAAAAALLGRCRELNEIAGGAIAAQRRDTNHALALLGIESEAPAYGKPATPARPARPGRALAVC